MAAIALLAAGSCARVILGAHWTGDIFQSHAIALPWAAFPPPRFVPDHEAVIPGISARPAGDYPTVSKCDIVIVEKSDLAIA
jgi:hypothetical protein